MDSLGGISPNPNQVPQPNSDPQQPPMPPQSPQMGPEVTNQQQAYIDPNGPGMQQPSTPSFDPSSMQTSDPGGLSSIPQQPVDPQLNQIDSILDQTPQQPVMSSGPNKMKVVIMIVAGVLLLIGAAGGGYALGYSSGKTAGKTAADAEYQAEQARIQEEQAADEEAKKPNKLDLSKQVEPDYSKDQDLEGELGDTLVAADGFVLRVNNIERNFTTDDPDFKPNEAKELIKVNFQMGNITKSKTMDINNSPFKLIDSSGSEVVSVAIAEYEGKFDVTKLEPGTQSNASLIFSVAKDDKPLQFVRKQQYRISNENREVTFTTTVEIAK